MERRWLEEQLGEGRSIESIAREVGRHPSTVAYWVRRHGLRSSHADRAAARGAIDRDELARLVAEGLTVREMAARLDRSYSTVRHWLGRYDLATTHVAGLGAAELAYEVERECPVHGLTVYRVNGREGRHRCVACVKDRVVARRRVVKEQLIREAGGACALCGYARCAAALHFHHIEPEGKRFTIARHGARAIELLREEAGKCVLLCANCHAEVEAGFVEQPVPPG